MSFSWARECGRSVETARWYERTAVEIGSDDLESALMCASQSREEWVSAVADFLRWVEE